MEVVDRVEDRLNPCSERSAFWRATSDWRDRDCAGRGLPLPLRALPGDEAEEEGGRRRPKEAMCGR